MKDIALEIGFEKSKSQVFSNQIVSKTNSGQPIQKYSVSRCNFPQNNVYFNINIPVAATTLILHQFPKNTPARFPSSAFPRNGICPDEGVAIRQPTAPRPICFSVDLKRGIKFSRMADDVLIESLRATCLDFALNPFSSSVFVFHY